MIPDIKSLIEAEFAGEPILVGESYTDPTPTTEGKRVFSVNTGGIVLQFTIPESATDAGLIEDFVQDVVYQTRKI